ncbi:hypothetical protein LSTR_LSTR016648, partial [Laodelphax striatellus]
NSYNRIIRESRDPSGKRSKKRKWYYYDAIQFLNEFVGVHRSSASKDDSLSVAQYVDESSDEALRHLELETEEINSEPNKEFSPSSAASPTVQPTSPFSNSALQKSTSSLEVVVEPVIDLYEPRTPRTKSRTEAESTTLVFFKSLVPDVDRLTQ